MTEESSSEIEQAHQPDMPQGPEEDEQQKPETVDEIYTIADKWIRTGLLIPFGDEQRFVQFQESDVTGVNLIGLPGISELPYQGRLEGLINRPIVTITNTPPKGSGKDNEAFGIGANPDTGEKFLEQRPYEFKQPEKTGDPAKDRELREVTQQIKDEDHLIDSKTGRTAIKEKQTREMRDRLARLTPRERVSREGLI